MTAVKAVLVDDIDDNPTPGAFEYFRDNERDVAGLFFNCPCGCGRQSALHFRPHPSPSWEWDGNSEAPTLRPSVHSMPDGKSHWHGWLTAGEWRKC